MYINCINGNGRVFHFNPKQIMNPFTTITDSNCKSDVKFNIQNKRYQYNALQFLFDITTSQD